MKKIYPVILTLLLIYFSFYYTNKVVGLIQSKDPIMVKINKEKDKYEVDAINAKVDSKNITPGRNGKVVNTSESFKKMKSYGKYNEELYVFDEVEPTVSIDDYYDRYINLGRNDSNKVSLVFKVEKNDSIEEVLKVLKDNGNLCIVHRTDRLMEILEVFRKHNIEPKRIRFVYENISKESTLVLIEAQKCGSVGLKVESPIILYNLDGSMTEEYKNIQKD